MSFDFLHLKENLGPVDLKMLGRAKERLDEMRSWGIFTEANISGIEAALSWMCFSLAELNKDRLMDHAAMDALREQLNAAEKRIERLQEKLSGGAGSHANGN